MCAEKVVAGRQEKRQPSRQGICTAGRSAREEGRQAVRGKQKECRMRQVQHAKSRGGVQVRVQCKRWQAGVCEEVVCKERGMCVCVQARKREVAR